jgi:DegV family protein with EDD domain
MIKVITDSTCDVPPDVVERLGIGVAPMIIEVDGATYEDGIQLTREQFYRDLPSYSAFPKTAANSPGAIGDASRAAGVAGADAVISIHISRSVSGVCAAADVATRDVAEEGIHVRVIDSASMSLGLGWLVIEAAELARRGAPADEIVAAVEALKPKIRIVAMADTLQYLRRSGRVTLLTAGIGELLQIKLLVELRSGAITPLDRVRTRGRGVARLLDEVRDTPGRPRRYSILYSGAHLPPDVGAVADQLRQSAPVEPPDAVQVTPIIGAHFGPNGLGVVIVGE